MIEYNYHCSVERGGGGGQERYRSLHGGGANALALRRSAFGGDSDEGVSCD